MSSFTRRDRRRWNTSRGDRLPSDLTKTFEQTRWTTFVNAERIRANSRYVVKMRFEKWRA